MNFSYDFKNIVSNYALTNLYMAFRIDGDEINFDEINFDRITAFRTKSFWATSTHL